MSLYKNYMQNIKIEKMSFFTYIIQIVKFLDNELYNLLQILISYYFYRINKFFKHFKFI